MRHLLKKDYRNRNKDDLNHLVDMLKNITYLSEHNINDLQFRELSKCL